MWQKCLKLLGWNEQRCLHCLAPVQISDPDAPVLCQNCVAQMAPYQGRACRGCCLPLPPDSKKLFCADCQTSVRPWDALACYGLYQGALRDAILRLKFNAELAEVSILANFLLEAGCCLTSPDALVPMPQHSTGLRKRGFNQTCELAKALASQTGLRLQTDWLLRIRSGTPQEQLSAQERKRNLHDAFKATPAVAGQSIWIIDDVMTTGSTLIAACEALKQVGAKKIQALVLARTPLFS